MFEEVHRHKKIPVLEPHTWNSTITLVRLKHGHRVEGEQSRNEVVWKDSEEFIESHDGVVVSLPSECDSILGRRQLFLHCKHVLVRLEIWVRLSNSHEP